MNKKKIVAIVLGLFWAILLIERFYLSSKELVLQTDSVAPQQRTELQTRNTKEISYPELRLSLSRKGLFTSPFQTIEEQNREKETKKVITLPAPPLPILPEPKTPQEKEKVVEKEDVLKDIDVVGVLDKKSKKVAFIKQKKEIKPFYVGEQVFNTKFFVEKISANVVILKNNQNEEIKLEIIKEEKDEKK